MKNTGKERIIIVSVADLLARGYNPEEIANAFVEINKKAWPPPFPQSILWTREQVLQHLINCPHILYCAIIKGEIVGTLSNIWTYENEALATKSWDSISGNGTLSTHRKDGDTGFGLDMSVLPEFQGRGVSQILAFRSFLIGVVLSNKKGVFLGARIPMFYKSNLSVADYVFGKNENGKALDPEIRLYLKDGFRIIKIVPNYIEDPESLNYGVLMFWKNPLYKFTKHLPLHWLKNLAKKIILG